VPAPAPTELARPFGAEELKTLPLQALLVRSGAITIDQLSEALRANVATGRSVEEIAIERGWVAAEYVAQLVAAKQAASPEAPAAEPAVQPAAQPLQQAHAVAPAQPAPVEAAQHVQHVQQVQPVETPPPAPPNSYVVDTPPPMGAGSAGAAPAQPQHSMEAEASVGVFLNLTDGQRVWVGRFGSEAEAERHAREVIQTFVRPEPGVWPRFGGRFVRPEAVVSVELSKRRDD